MEKIFISLLIITSSCSFAAKHIFIQNRLRWLDARQYCREQHTDLSPLTNELEEKVFRESVDRTKSGWIGFHCHPEVQSWRWSGGNHVSNEERAPRFLTAVNWTHDGWHPSFGWFENSFFCLNLIVVKEQKTWEEAQTYCRQEHTDLTSLLSETENLLARQEILENSNSYWVWIGLRYLDNSWQWANGDPLQYEAWNQGDQDHLSPTEKLCGALAKDGKWVNTICQDRRNFICV